MTTSPKFRVNMSNAPAQAAQSAQEREPELFWGNVGVYATAHDDEGNEVNQFISLNHGIPLSSVQEMKINGSPEWQMMCAAKNDMLAQIMEIVSNLEPGETYDIPMTLQLRHVQQKTAVSREENAFQFKLGGSASK